MPSLQASIAAPPAAIDGTTPDLRARFATVRARTRALAAPLSAEDAQLQCMADASPAKWHLAHTTWFFARFVLGRLGEPPIPAGWDYLFNSYYVGAGERHPRASRGLVSRPTLAEVLAWRDAVDDRVLALLDAGGLDAGARDVLLLGTHHEQQHQELLLTDIKHAFWSNPLAPAYHPPDADASVPGAPAAAEPGLRWLARDETLTELGAAPWPGGAFAFDNETPRHRALVPAHALASRAATNAEFAAFVDDAGYATPTLWLSDGWDLAAREGWQRPLYWHADGVREFTLAGWRERDPHAPACHLSHYEADAFARWAGARLPTEAEWELAAAGRPVEGDFADGGIFQPRAQAAAGNDPHGLFGGTWEWTSSAYAPYPGFRPLPGTLGEYNGKFMSGQLVLRGGSCATPRDHARASYRNFFAPSARWQFSGVRLARDRA
ncbi:ergothioneine biosynthesis protein EgtB [Luteimonas sp. MC1782]|uniref:ergothioneine biosynthesis protein EgtB n=1 Tax=Luteimonas sp. MC1782 TaxID=2760305 RepID=UPI0015FEE5A2|nr:ergothioneine biosynthesis protein EgtB [Luteimonas sp. MC1782]MBB1472462.1 ergothioneine biosynthesis protein EgtB [Luteimonas sp. MC1782]